MASVGSALCDTREFGAHTPDNIFLRPFGSKRPFGASDGVVTNMEGAARELADEAAEGVGNNDLPKKKKMMNGTDCCVTFLSILANDRVLTIRPISWPDSLDFNAKI